MRNTGAPISNGRECFLFSVSPFFLTCRYAIRSYDAPSEEQLSAIVGEPMSLLDDADVEWWYCTNMRTQMSGYIPAMFIESTESRKARINTIRNKQVRFDHAAVVTLTNRVPDGACSP